MWSTSTQSEEKASRIPSVRASHDIDAMSVADTAAGRIDMSLYYSMVISERSEAGEFFGGRTFDLENGMIKYCNVIGQCLDSKSHRILSAHLYHGCNHWTNQIGLLEVSNSHRHLLGGF